MQRRAKSVEKMQVFWPWSSLRMSACTVPRTPPRALARTPAASSRLAGRPCSRSKAASCCVDHGVQEHRQDRRRRPVDRHRDARRRRAEVEAGVEDLHVVEGRDAHAGGADLAVHVGALGGVAPVEGDRVEGGGQARGRLPLGEQVEPPVGARRVALAGEHAGRRLGVPLQREDAGGEREGAGQVLAAQEAHQVAVVRGAGQGDAAQLRAGQALPDERGADLATPDGVDELVAGVLLDRRRPALELLLRRRRPGGRRPRRRVRPAARRRDPQIFLDPQISLIVALARGPRAPSSGAGAGGPRRPARWCAGGIRGPFRRSRPGSGHAPGGPACAGRTTSDGDGGQPSRALPAGRGRRAGRAGAGRAR